MFDFLKKKYLFAVTVYMYWQNEYGPDEKAGHKQIVHAVSKNKAIEKVLDNAMKEFDSEFYKLEISCVPAYQLFQSVEGVK